MGVNQIDCGKLGSDVIKQVQSFIRADNKPAFVSFFRSQLKKEKLGDSTTATVEAETGQEEELTRVHCKPGSFFFRSLLEMVKPWAEKNVLHSSDIMLWICFHGAKDCATALLEGETGLEVDLNVPLGSGYYPLHHAAGNLSSSLTEIFLRHGALTSLRCSVDSSRCNGMLPLHVALEALHSHPYLTDWTPGKSIFKLIYILCMPQLHEPLETIKLLALNTEELAVIGCLKAEEGRLVELAALLLVAGDKLLEPVNCEEGVDSSVIGQCIDKQLRLLIPQEFKLMGTDRTAEYNKCIQMKNVMLSASVMLMVFERVGDTINRYRDHLASKRGLPNYILVRNTICLMKGLGFALQREDMEVDDMQCFLHRMSPQESDKLRKSLDYILNSGPGSGSSGHAQLSSICGLPSQRAVVFSSSHSQGSSASAPKSFHTFPPVRISQHFDYATPVDVLSNGVPDSQCKHQCLVRTGQDLPSTIRVPNTQYRNRWACFVATLKRRIRYI